MKFKSNIKWMFPSPLCFSVWTGRTTCTTWSSGESCSTTRPPGSPRTWTFRSLTSSRCSTGTTGERETSETETHEHKTLPALLTVWFLFQRADDGRGRETREEDQGERKSEAAWQASWEPRGGCEWRFTDLNTFYTELQRKKLQPQMITTRHLDQNWTTTEWKVVWSSRDGETQDISAGSVRSSYTCLQGEK